ncbi:hypothetical protein E2C01_090716 [Portunus trituberculatus]|uniref:Uncharacterized protein n=1 Tax=Portunus trituberculatus TaxID=210409 RepID=A0A5B7JFH0_PORTR|nr:hypothetical protein [Portunus trituberculatus]
MGPKNPAEVIPDHPSKICYRPVRLPLPLEEQSDVVKVSPGHLRPSCEEENACICFRSEVSLCGHQGHGVI